jgi:hypothetical protein
MQKRFARRRAGVTQVRDERLEMVGVAVSDDVSDVVGIDQPRLNSVDRGLS